MESNERNPFGIVDPEEFKNQTDAVRSSLESTAVRVASASLSATSGSSGAGSSSIGGSGSAFSTQEIKEFIQELIKVQKEYDELAQSMSKVISNQAEASKVMQQVSEIATKSPFSVKELTSASEHLLSCGTETKELVAQLEMLGNVATGTSTPLDRLTNLFGEMQKSGSVSTESLDQMASMGIPVYEQLATVMGITADEARNSTVSFDDMQQVFWNLTAAGGQFENSMREQSISMNELFGTIKTGWDTVMTGLGGEDNPLISGNMGKYVAENYKVIGEAITTLKDAHGIYKAALAVSNAIENSAIVAKKGLLTVTTLLTAAQKGLNAVLAKNPFVLIATVALTAATAIARFTRTTKEATRETEATTKPIREEYGATQILLDKLKDANTQEEERRRILARLRELNPDVVKGIEDENMALDETNEKIEENMHLSLLQAAMKEKAASTNHTKTLNELQEAADRKRESEVPAINYLADFNDRYQNKKATAHKGELNTLSKEIDEIMNSSETAAEKMIKLHELKQKLEEPGAIWGNRDIMRELFSGIDMTAINYSFENYNNLSEQYIQSTTRMREEAEKLVALMNLDPEQSKKLVDSLMESLAPDNSEKPKAVTPKSNNNASKQRENDQKELKELTRKAQEDLEKMTFDIQADGMQKRLDLSQQEYKKKEDQLKESYERQKKLYKDLKMNDPELLHEIENTYASNISLNKQAKDKRDQQIREDGQASFDKMMEEVNVSKGSQESKRVADINKKAEDRIKYAAQQLAAESISTEQYDAYISQVEVARTAELTEELLGHYKDYYTRREELDQEYMDKEQTLLSDNSLDPEVLRNALEELHKEWDGALAAMDIEKFKGDVDFDDFIANMDMLSGNSLTMFRKKFANFLQQAGDQMNPEDLKGLTAVFEQLDLKIAQKDPFGELKGSVEGYTAANQRLKEVKQALIDSEGKENVVITVYDKNLKESVQLTVSKEEAEKRLKDAEIERATALQKLNASVSGAAAIMKEYMGAAGSVMGTLEDFGIDVPDSIKGAMEGMNQTMDSLASINFSNPASIITGAAGALSGVVKTVSSLFNKDNKKRERDPTLAKGGGRAAKGLRKLRQGH